MRVYCCRAIFVLMSTLLVACGGSNDRTGSPPPPQQYSFDFSNGTLGWVGGSADYPVIQETEMDIHTEIRNLPSPLDQNRTAYYIGGWNFSDDLYMYVKKRITGLKPDHAYQIMFSVSFATHDAEVGVNMGVQTGASPTEPNRITVQRNSTDYYVMNVSKGAPIGDNTKPTPGSPDWELKTLRTTTPVTARTDSDGSLWLLVGADSYWESISELYFTKIDVEVRED